MDGTRVVRAIKLYFRQMVREQFPGDVHSYPKEPLQSSEELKQYIAKVKQKSYSI